MNCRDRIYRVRLRGSIPEADAINAVPTGYLARAPFVLPVAFPV